MRKPNRNKIIAIILALALLLPLLVQQSSALGIAPSREVAAFTSNEQLMRARVINNEHKDTLLRLSVQGELAPYISLQTAAIEMGGEDAEVPFTYTLRLPESSESPEFLESLPPGLRKGEIIVMETTQQAGSSQQDQGALIQSALAVIHEVHVNVPYPGTYAEGELYASPGSTNDTIIFTANIMNRGTQRIEGLDATLRIKDLRGNEIESLPYSYQGNIDPHSSQKIAIPWKAEVPAGAYSATLTVDYGAQGKALELPAEFIVGTFIVDISELYVDSFKLGAIGEFNMRVYNRWNQQVPNVYADLEIRDIQGNALGTVTTNSITLAPHGTALLQAYWNTKGIDPGSYDVNVALHYDYKVSQRLFRAVVGLDSITLQDYSLAGKVVDAESSSQLPFTSILIMLLIAVNIAWFVYFKRIRRGQPPQANA